MLKREVTQADTCAHRKWTTGLPGPNGTRAGDIWKKTNQDLENSGMFQVNYLGGLLKLESKDTSMYNPVILNTKLIFRVNSLCS